MTKPIAVTEENLDELLAQMEAELGGAAPPPVPAPKKSEPVGDAVLDELAELEALEGTTVAVAPAPAPAAVAPTVIDELAELEALEMPTTAKGPVPDLVPEPKQPTEYPFKTEPTPAPAKPALEVVAPPPAEVIEAAEPPKAETRVPPEARTSTATGLEFYVDEDAFRVATSVNEVNLDQAMMEQSGLRSYYGAMLARAEAQHARVKARFEVKEAQLYDGHRRSLAEAGEKVTEKAVENAVKLDPAWLTAKNLVIEAESIASVLKALNESLKDRRDMVIQLGADRRDDAKGQLRVLAAQQTREQAMAAAKRALSA